MRACVCACRGTDQDDDDDELLNEDEEQTVKIRLDSAAMFLFPGGETE